MPLSRRDLLTALPLLPMTPGLAVTANDTVSSQDASLFASPPVVQHADEDGFSVSIEVSRMCTGRIEWGLHPDRLDRIAVSSHHGLIDASGNCLVISARFPKPVPCVTPVYYRVVGRRLDYVDAYRLTRGAPVATAVRRLKRLGASLPTVRLAIVNDTHGHDNTIRVLAERIATIDPDALVWNGDTCNDFNKKDDPTAILLRPGAGANLMDGGWASTRPLLFVPGNHDVRGERARRVANTLIPSEDSVHPYNVAFRSGSLAIISLDTGEDKPDRHPVFAGTAAYEPYRRSQASWLRRALARPEIASAPFKVACCHIPLRGLPGHNDGTTLKGYARFSGQGAALWLPQLASAGFQAVVSGHTHRWRFDQATAQQPVCQIVGGGPEAANATLITIEAGRTMLLIRVEDLKGTILHTARWPA
jgi:acid phosphatase type 7